MTHRLLFSCVNLSHNSKRLVMTVDYAISWYIFCVQAAVWSAPFSTADWYTYVDNAGAAPVALTAGTHTVTLCISAGDANVDKFM